MWLRIKWHCKLVHGDVVYRDRTCAETTAVSRATSNVTTKQRCNQFVDIHFALCKATAIHSDSHTTRAQMQRFNSTIVVTDCEALRAQLEMIRCSTGVHISNIIFHSCLWFSLSSIHKQNLTQCEQCQMIMLFIWPRPPQPTQTEHNVSNAKC